MARTGRPAGRYVAAVARAVELLDLLAAGPGAMGTNVLARRAGMSPSTVSRTLATLAAGGLVVHVPESGRYRLGVRLLELGHAALAGLDLRTAARPHLTALVEATGETATISAPAPPDAVTVDFVQSPASVQSVAQLGRPSVAHATAAGKVVLAFGGIGLPPGPLRAFTRRTLTERAALAREVARVRRQGWARAVREREDDLSALAAPVGGAAGEDRKSVV
jgi:DNA-binding IclR family transcriptional regulator